MPGTPLSIAQVTPHAWESGHELNDQIARQSAELAGRGHRVLIVAPSTSARLVRDSRAAIRSGGDLWAGPSDGVRVLAVGEVVPAPVATQRRGALPIDVTRSIEELFTTAALDLCHVHEPFAPSTSSAALRHSRALNVGTFHQPTERIVATQMARKLVDLVLGRLDARLASFQATADLLNRHFPAVYEILGPGVDVTAGAHAIGDGGPVRIVFVDGEERAALRLFLRALRRLAPGLDFMVTVVSDRGPSSSTPLRADLRERVRFVPRTGPGALSEADAFAAADVAVFASDGGAPAPAAVVRALAAGVVPLCSSLAVYEEVTGEGEHGLLFATSEPQTCAEQLARLVTEPALLAKLRVAGEPVRAQLGWDGTTDALLEAYERTVARRHDPEGDPVIRARLRSRPLIDVDLHMHTDHSGDCATPVEVLLATAREQGLGAIAVTDHNEVSGAFDAQAKAAEYGIKIIIGEEVKTASQGEVIGLFLTEKIPRGLTLQETVAEIKRQGGLVYVPHPFDRMHSVPDYEHLLAIVDDIDAIEIYNPRVAIGSFNEEAERFAAKYRIVAGAGSDSHVAQGLGSVRIRMPDFDGPAEFKEALAMADIQTKPSSLLYVQALKFIETKATPAGARKARKARRVARAEESKGS